MIYLDYNATTPVDKRVLNTFNKVCLDYPGNSNSLHKLGVEAKELEDYSTKRIGELLKLIMILFIPVVLLKLIIKY